MRAMQRAVLLALATLTATLAPFTRACLGTLASLPAALPSGTLASGGRACCRCGRLLSEYRFHQQRRDEERRGGKQGIALSHCLQLRGIVHRRGPRAREAREGTETTLRDYLR